MDALVSTERLAQRLGTTGLVVLDASSHLPAAGRNARAEFAECHIPGARFLDLATLKDGASPVPSALPTADQFARRMRELGVNRGDRVVLYDDSDVKTSARAWLMCSMVGVEAAILDGGLAKWKFEHRALECGDPPIAAGDFEPNRDDRSLVRTKSDLLANLDGGAEQVVDARDRGRFTGETEDTVQDLPGGHLPGARNLFFRDLYRENGTFRSATEMRRAFEDAGIDLARPVVSSCGSGVTASVLHFALHLLGKEDSAVYDGSWSEWGADPATPKETGEAR